MKSGNTQSGFKFKCSYHLWDSESEFPLYPISLDEMEISPILTIAGSTKLRQIKETNTQ